MLRTASAVVIRCFRKVEHATDYLTGAAGPIFVALAWLLTGVSGLAFFDVISRHTSGWVNLLLLPVYILVPLNMYGQYYLVTHVPSGYPQVRDASESAWMDSTQSALAPERWGWHKAGLPLRPPGPPPGVRVRRCRKCQGPKPERTHHCRVCKRCVLQMDHHCPWINACVGLHNQRHFILYMAWLSLACWIVVALGWDSLWRSVNFDREWPSFTPRVVFTIAYALAVTIGFSVPLLCAWQLFLVMRGETSIESHDNDYLERKARGEGLVYLNKYDLGRRRNLELFFHVGRGGYPVATLLFPLRVPPSTNGWEWPYRSWPTVAPRGKQGEELPHGSGDGPGGRYIMGSGDDDLTDDEDGGGGWWDEDAQE